MEGRRAASSPHLCPMKELPETGRWTAARTLNDSAGSFRQCEHSSPPRPLSHIRTSGDLGRGGGWLHSGCFLGRGCTVRGRGGPGPWEPGKPELSGMNRTVKFSPAEAPRGAMVQAAVGLVPHCRRPLKRHCTLFLLRPRDGLKGEANRPGWLAEVPARFPTRLLFLTAVSSVQRMKR